MSSPSRTRSKRQRLDDSPRPELTRSIWHPDGSIVLQAENTQFRVHWSVLASNSSFFRDMQGLPQPPGQPSVEGCPVIELSDSVEDVENLLKALYNPLFFAQKALPLPVIASHVRLGRKYDFTDILHSIVERLTYENPTSLEAHDALKIDQKYLPTRIVAKLGFYYDTVALARETNILSILPCAYYRVLLSSSPTEIFVGISRGNGTIATLSPIDQHMCSVGRAAILRAQWDTGNTFGWLQDIDTPHCLNPHACRREKTAYFHKHVVNGSLLAFPSEFYLKKLCPVCNQEGKAKMIIGRKKMWEMLPTYFELPPWGELKNDL